MALKYCCPTPAIPLLRSSFEALISIEYILENETDYSNRSLAWLAQYARHRLSNYDQLDPNCQKGKEFLASFTKDQWIPKVPPLPDLTEVNEARKNLNHFLARPEFEPIIAEFNRSKTDRIKNPEWYRLFNGPTKIQGLATRVNRKVQYELLYRSWSNFIHAGDISRFITRDDQGQQAIFSIRNPKMLCKVTFYSAHFILEATRLLLGKFRTGERENFTRWYQDEVQERYLQISNTRIHVS